MKKIIITFLLLSFLGAKGQSPDFDNLSFSNKIFSEKIKTVQLYKEGWNLSYPILKHNSGEKLILNFDLLGNQPESYYYTFIHCDKDWNKSDIFPNDYLAGYEENPLEDYTYSFNTTVSYIHYNLSFPNDRADLKLSGNYVVVIYPAGQRENPVITQRFVITEDAVKINVTAHRPLMTKENNTHQQVDFTVKYSGQSINDPYRNVFAFILQNGRWDTAKRNLKPDYYGDNELKYSSLSDKNIFPGGNEFRYFDIKSLRYRSEYVKMIDYLVTNYNIYLFPSDNRALKPYFYWQDFNGKYYIVFQEGRRPDIESDYVNVYFTLPSESIVPGGNVYISGGLNNWFCDKSNLMSYNAERREYEGTLLLKQGWYNYEYTFVKDDETNGSTSVFEGNHYETENDYVILVYYRNPNDRYDRVLGATIANTLGKAAN